MTLFQITIMSIIIYVFTTFMIHLLIKVLFLGTEHSPHKIIVRLIVIFFLSLGYIVLGTFLLNNILNKL